MKDVDDFMKKIDYLVRVGQRTTYPPLNSLGKPIFPSSHKPLPKENIKQHLFKKSREEIEELYDNQIKQQKIKREREEKERYFNQPSYNADFN